MQAKILIGIISCGQEKYREKVQAQRDTWIKDIVGMDYKVFLGRESRKIHEDEVILDCSDTYGGLPEKIRLMFKWALENGYDHVFRVDDDVYVQPGRLLKYAPLPFDYTGRLRGPSGTWRHPYCSGFAYWLSRRAMEVRVYGELPEDTVEDRTTGTMMARAGIQCNPDYRYVVATSNKNGTSGQEGPRRGNDVIASCEYSAESMRMVHEEWADLESMGTRRMEPSGTPFDRINILVKTFMRDPMLFRCIDSIQRWMPGAKMIIMDDGFESRQKIKRYSELRELGHICAWMDFDAGFGAKSNYAKRYYDREFVLVFSDDFICTKESAEGVLKMVTVLDHTTLGIVSGRVDDDPYESDIIEKVAENGLKDLYMVKPRGQWSQAGGVEYLVCDQTVNYNLIRREVFEHLLWSEEFKIGGDHLLMYQQVAKAGYMTAYVKGVNVRQQTRKPGDVLPAYDVARGRARLALPSLFKRCGWRSFTSLDGRVDTLESVQKWCDQYTRPASYITEEGRVDRRAIRSDTRKQKLKDRLARREELQKRRPEIFTKKDRPG